MFADDIKIRRRQEAAQTLCDEIDRLSVWIDPCLMEFRAAKCIVRRTKRGRDQCLPAGELLMSAADKKMNIVGINSSQRA